jgi:hypothetical protein
MLKIIHGNKHLSQDVIILSREKLLEKLLQADPET